MPVLIEACYSQWLIGRVCCHAMVIMLLEHMSTERGDSSLHVACSLSDGALVLLLLNHGADVNAVNKNR